MFQIRKFKLMRPFFGWIWALKPDFIETYCHFLEQVSDFIALPPHPAKSKFRFPVLESSQPSRNCGTSHPGRQISRFWFWNFGVRGSVETRVLPAKLIL